jgi:hypothetical protein
MIKKQEPGSRLHWCHPGALEPWSAAWAARRWCQDLRGTQPEEPQIHHDLAGRGAPQGAPHHLRQDGDQPAGADRRGAELIPRACCGEVNLSVRTGHVHHPNSHYASF